MVAPLFGDEADQDREVVEAVVPVMLSDPGVVGAVATETVMVAVVVPLPFTAVKVYRVVVERAGVVVLLPVTVPILGLMDREVALATVQLSVEVPFRATTAGEAVNEEMVGRVPDCAFTVVHADPFHSFTKTCLRDPISTSPQLRSEERRVGK